MFLMFTAEVPAVKIEGAPGLLGGIHSCPYKFFQVGWTDNQWKKAIVAVLEFGGYIGGVLHEEFVKVVEAGECRFAIPFFGVLAWEVY